MPFINDIIDRFGAPVEPITIRGAKESTIMNPQRPNSGILFRKSRKLNDQSPDYTGAINIDGAEHTLNAWIKEGRNGKFLSLSVRAKSATTAASTASANAANDFPSDEIGF